MKRNVTGKSVDTFNYAGDTIMKGKSVIRIRRNNELNKYWVFLIVIAVTLTAASLKVETSIQMLLVIYASLIILIIALLYQGFEIMKE